MDDKEYQRMELDRFMRQDSAYFDAVAEFAEWLRKTDVLEQIEWIENGSYGAGACFALQKALAGLNKRTNDNARVGGVVLRAFYGKAFAAWGRLPKDVQDQMNAAVSAWLKQEHDFAARCEV